MIIKEWVATVEGDEEKGGSKEKRGRWSTRSGGEGQGGGEDNDTER